MSKFDQIHVMVFILHVLESVYIFCFGKINTSTCTLLEVSKYITVNLVK